MPQEATELKERLESYRQSLGKLGMRDYQVGIFSTATLVSFRSSAN